MFSLYETSSGNVSIFHLTNKIPRALREGHLRFHNEGRVLYDFQPQTGSSQINFTRKKNTSRQSQQSYIQTTGSNGLTGDVWIIGLTVGRYLRVLNSTCSLFCVVKAASTHAVKLVNH